jgi:hypothetical protein
MGEIFLVIYKYQNSPTYNKEELIMKILRGYKLFEQDPMGNLYPLFIGKKESMPMGEWIKAKILPTKGFSVRPGLHIGQICSAPWLMSADGTYKSQRSKYWKRVWVEVEYIADYDYTEEVEQLPKKCFQDKLPEDGFYKFKETGCNRIWIIADQMRIVKVLSEEERQGVLKEANYDEMEAFEPYRQAMAKRMKAV